MKKIIIAIGLLFWTLLLTWCFEKKQDQTSPTPSVEQTGAVNQIETNTWYQNISTWTEAWIWTGENPWLTWDTQPSNPVKVGTWSSTSWTWNDDQDVEEIVNALNQIIEEEDTWAKTK